MYQRHILPTARKPDLLLNRVDSSQQQIDLIISTLKVTKLRLCIPFDPTDINDTLLTTDIIVIGEALQKTRLDHWRSRRTL